MIIMDEVQLFPAARQAVKYLAADGRFDYIETGSLISIKKMYGIYCIQRTRNLKMESLICHFTWLAVCRTLLIDNIYI